MKQAQQIWRPSKRVLFSLYLLSIYHFSFAIKGKKLNPDSKIKRRQKNGQLTIYWRKLHRNDTSKQKQFYWGDLPTKKLNALLLSLNHPGQRARIRIGQIVGLNVADLPDIQLQNSDFLKTEIFGRLRDSERARIKGDKRNGQNRSASQSARIPPSPTEALKSHFNTSIEKTIKALRTNPHYCPDGHLRPDLKAVLIEDLRPRLIVWDEIRQWLRQELGC